MSDIKKWMSIVEHEEGCKEIKYPDGSEKLEYPEKKNNC